jgi:hypothetical protein
MKYVFLTSFCWILCLNSGLAQQFLTTQLGYQPLIYHTRELDDEMLSLSLEPGNAAFLGGEYKFFFKGGVSNVFALDYSYTPMKLNSVYDKTSTWGEADLDIQFHQTSLSYLMEYSVKRRIEYYLSAGPSLNWLVYTKAEGFVTEKFRWNNQIETEEWIPEGNSNRQMSRGTLGLLFRTGFRFPVKKDLTWNLGVGIRADLNNHPEENFAIAFNRSINQLIYIQVFTGLSFDLGRLIQFDEE